MRSSRVKTLIASASLLGTLSTAQAAVLQWGTTFTTIGGNNTNASAPTTGNWSGANWTFRSGTDLGTAGIPDSGDTAQIGFITAATTVTVDGTYDLNTLDLRPRRSDFSNAHNITLNSSSGLLRIGSGGIAVRNGGLAAVNVPIQLTANQSFVGFDNGSGTANFNTTISGNFKLTRSAAFPGVFQFFAGNSTFNGFVQDSATTRIGNSSSGSAAGGGVLGSGTVELTGGTLSSDGATTRTINNAVEVRGNVALGATATQTGTLNFNTTWSGTSFNLYSTTSDVNRTLTINSAVSVSHAIGETGGGTNLGLTKAGASTLTLRGTNTYTGLTTVSAGTLTLNGSSLATSEITVSGGTLQGDATNKGTINFGIAGDTFDTMNVTSGTLSLTNLILALNLTGSNAQTEYVLVNKPVGSALIGGTNFSSVTGLPAFGSIDYDGTVANPGSIVLVIPEPTSLGLLGVGLVFCMRRRR